MESWGSRRGFLLAAVGSAVGVGNIWRFPSVLGQNGGGAYLVPYLVAIFVFALPLLVLELAAGRRLRANAVQAYRMIGRRTEVVGWLTATVVFTILSYYLVITGWTLAYFLQAVTGDIEQFAAFSAGYGGVYAFLVSGVVTGLVTSLGVRHGIELLSTWLMPAAFVILIGLAVYAMTLDGFGAGVSFVFSPDFGRLAEPGIWTAAFGQAFFSLSVGFGIMLTYGSYLDRGTDRSTDLVGSAGVISVADLAVALLAGIVIFPIVFTQGLEPTAGTELAFSTLPTAFEGIPAGRFIAAAFFLMLFAAALTSAISMMELNIAAVTEKTRLGRRTTAAILTMLVLALGLPSALSYSGASLEVFGTRVLDLLDETVGNLGLPIAALLIAIFFTRRIERSALVEEFGAERGGWRLALIPLLRWVIPGVLIAVLATDLVLNVNPEAWSQLVRRDDMAVWEQALVTAVLGPGLLGATLIVMSVLRRFGRRRSSEPGGE